MSLLGVKGKLFPTSRRWVKTEPPKGALGTSSSCLLSGKNPSPYGEEPGEPGGNERAWDENDLFPLGANAIDRSQPTNAKTRVCSRRKQGSRTLHHRRRGL